jgi:hypothetical protein
LGKLLWAPMNYGRLPVKRLPEEWRKLRQSDVETLLLTGNIDFSTPAQFGAELLPYLKNGKQVVISECGHSADVLNPDVGNAAPMLKSFYDDGVVDESGNKYVPMKFDISFGFPAMAKTAVGVVVFFCVCGFDDSLQNSQACKRKFVPATRQ